MATLKHSGWLAWFAGNPVAANLLMAIILTLGIATGIKIRTEGFPASAPRNVTISINFEGGSPEVIEEGVAVKVEDALDGVAGIKRITSTVTENNATIVVRAKEGYPVATLKDDIKIRVDAISTFPAQVEDTVITEELEESHVIYVEFYGDTDHATLKEVAQRVKERLLELDNVNKIITNGARNYEINIEVEEDKLRSYGLSFDEVARAIQGDSINLSAGTLKTSQGAITLQSRQQRYYGQEFADIIIRSSQQGGVVRLADIAKIRDAYTEQTVVSRFQGEPSINLDVQLIGRASITEASKSIEEELERIRYENWLPEEVIVATWMDEANIIRDRLNLLFNNALIGMILVLVMLALFLNLKVALWVALGIPVSFAGALTVMGPGFLDYSINDLTTFAFIIVLGIVVDDAIVIGESIYTAVQRDGGGLESAIRGAKEVAAPATFGVLTTVAAFFPLTLISGDFGGPFRLIAIITIICLIFSLVESKLILPAHLTKLQVRGSGRQKSSGVGYCWSCLQRKIDDLLQYAIVRYYKPAIELVNRHRYQSLGVFVAMWILVAGLVGSGVIRTVFFISSDADVLFAKVTMISGTPATETDRVLKDLEQGLKRVNQHIKRKYQMDKNPVSYTYTSSSEDEKGVITVMLLSGGERLFSGQDVINQWRAEVGNHPHIKDLDFYTWFDEEADVQVNISSPDFVALEQAIKELKRKISEYSGVHDIKTNHDNTTEELTVRLNPEAESLGLSSHDVISQLRNAVFGYSTQRVQRDQEDIRIKVRYPLMERNDISDVEQIRIRTEDGGTVPLTTVATLFKSRALTQVDRVNGKRVLELTARVDKELVTGSDITEVLAAEVFPELERKYPGIVITLEGESAEEANATRKLMYGFMFGLFMIYALLAIPLQSYTGPIVIMLAIPFGIIGAIIGHIIIGIPLSMLSFFGVLALSGVVVNDSLVLVTKYNQLREKGFDFDHAIVQAGMSRFRAIFLTSVTTFMGLFPLILEKSEQAQLLIPMAVSLAFGILFATIITLFIIPVLLGVRLDIIRVLKGSQGIKFL